MSHETFKEGGWGGAEWKSSICDRHTISIGKENASETTDAQRNISFRKLVLGVMEKAASSLRAAPLAPLSYWPLLGKRNIWRLDEAWKSRRGPVRRHSALDLILFEPQRKQFNRALGGVAAGMALCWV